MVRTWTPVIFAPVEMDRAERLYNALRLDGTPFADIDRDLLLLAITHPSGFKTLSQEVRDRLASKFAGQGSSISYQRFEFLGDAVLEMIITHLVMGVQWMNSARLTEFRSKLVRNTVLRCFMLQKDLCELINVTGLHRRNPKVCADVFEAILGVLYWHLAIVRDGRLAALDAVAEWLLREWPFNEAMNTVLDMGFVICQHGGTTEYI